MIRLENLNIAYDREILKAGKITIKDNAITVITGRSGSGKTALLYRLGIISSDNSYAYYLDNKRINMNDKKEVSEIQQYDFGYLFQDGSLIDGLSIEDNIIFSAKIAGYRIEQETIKKILHTVELSENVLKMYPSMLSGGEQQRASLAMILAKRTKYIFADEPTASLDPENEKIILDIFMRLKESGHTIVISSHSKSACDIADVVYEIENEELILRKSSDNECENKQDNQRKQNKIKFKISNWYAGHVKKKGKILRWILTIFCAVAIAGFAITNNILVYLMQMQADVVNTLSDRELFVVNQNDSSEHIVLDADGNISLSEEEITRIRNMNGVDKLYDFMEWRSFDLNSDLVTIENTIDVIADHNNYDVEYSLDNNGRDYYVVLPHFEETNIENRLYKHYKDVNTGIFISYDMAGELGLLEEDRDSVRIRFNAGIPQYKLQTELENGTEADMDILKFKTFDFAVEGILDESVTNRYTINGNSVIYMPYEVMEEEQKTILENADERDNMFKWSPSACVVFARSYENIPTLKSKIESITPNIATRYDYSDTVSLEKLMKNLKDVSNVVIGLVLLIIFVLMFAVFVSNTMARKREYAILKANGFSTKVLSQITAMESARMSIRIFVVSLIVSSIITGILSFMLLGQLTFFTKKSLVITLLLAIIYVAIPSLISIIYISSLKVEKILRN